LFYLNIESLPALKKLVPELFESENMLCNCGKEICEFAPWVSSRWIGIEALHVVVVEAN